VVLDAFHLTGLRQLIFSADPELRRLATAALGALGDVDSFELLTGFLDSSDPLEQGTARRSLQDISGVDLGPQTKSWTSWYAAEQTWWDEQAPSEFERLRSTDPREVHAAIGALVRHPLFRDSITSELGPLASHDDAVVAAATCRALARLRSPVAIPWLVEALADEDEGRRKQAARVLRELTGLDLPDDHQVWTRELGPRALLR
jgi:HEAT repeat protein